MDNANALTYKNITNIGLLIFNPAQHDNNLQIKKSKIITAYNIVILLQNKVVFFVFFETKTLLNRLIFIQLLLKTKLIHRIREKTICILWRFFLIL